MAKLKSEITKAIADRLSIIEALLPQLEKEVLALQETSNTRKTKTNVFDLVTEADLHSEKIITSAIQKHFSDDAIVAEVGTNSDAQNSESFTWVIDPIDGTVNYANRLHHWGISVGVVYQNKPVGGIVSAPALNLRYRAIQGQGATKNGVPIKVSDKSKLSQGVVVTGFPYDRAIRAEHLTKALANFLKVVGGMRRYGAASIDFCSIADGTIIGYYEMQLKPWDMAAGLVIAEEAGAKITDFNGNPVNLFESHGVVVANPKIHTIMLPLTAPMLDAIAVTKR
jgi:myo-inositol-1(or 4)-monophosphatase